MREIVTREELDEFIREYKRLTSKIPPKSMKKYKGRAFSKIMCNIISKHLPSNYEVIEQGWVDGHPNELDLIIVKKTTNVDPVDPAVQKEAVVCTCELKASGIMENPEKTQRTLMNMQERIEHDTGKPFIYITLYENIANSEATRKALGKNAFILTSGKQSDPTTFPDEWVRFISTLIFLAG